MLANAICSKLPDSGITYLPNSTPMGSSFRKSNTILTFVLNLLQPDLEDPDQEHYHQSQHNPKHSPLTPLWLQPRSKTKSLHITCSTTSEIFLISLRLLFQARYLGRRKSTTKGCPFGYKHLVLPRKCYIYARLSSVAPSTRKKSPKTDTFL